MKINSVMPLVLIFKFHASECGNKENMLLLLLIQTLFRTGTVVFVCYVLFPYFREMIWVRRRLIRFLLLFI